MLKILAYKTRDGLLFDEQSKADEHARRVKQEALQNLRLVVQYDLKLSSAEAIKVVEWIDNMKEHLLELQAMDEDLLIVPQSEFED